MNCRISIDGSWGHEPWQREYVLSKQLLRSNIAVGALIREAQQAESRRDFIHKLSISLKEAQESEYWLLLLKETGYISEEILHSLQDDCVELIKILTTNFKSAKGKS